MLQSAQIAPSSLKGLNYAFKTNNYSQRHTNEAEGKKEVRQSAGMSSTLVVICIIEFQTIGRVLGKKETIESV